MAQLMTKFIWLLPYWEMESLINSWSASETIWKEKLLGKIFLKWIYLVMASFKCSLWNHHFISVLFNMSAWTTSNQYKDVLSTKSGTWALLNIYWLGKKKKKCNCKLKCNDGIITYYNHQREKGSKKVCLYRLFLEYENLRVGKSQKLLLANYHVFLTSEINETQRNEVILPRPHSFHIKLKS